MRTFYLVTRYWETTLSNDDLRHAKEITPEDASSIARQWAEDESEAHFVYEVTLKPIKRVDVDVKVETTEVAL